MEPELKIKISTPGEYAGVAEGIRYLERMKGKAMVAGTEWGHLEKQIIKARAALEEYERTRAAAQAAAQAAEQAKPLAPITPSRYSPNPQPVTPALGQGADAVQKLASSFQAAKDPARHLAREFLNINTEAAKSPGFFAKFGNQLEAIVGHVPGLRGLAAAIGRVGAVGGPAAGAIAAFTASLAIAKKTLSEFITAETATKKLEIQLESSGQAVAGFKKHILDLADAQQKATGKDSDEWVQGFARIIELGAAGPENIDKVGAAFVQLAALMKGDIAGAAERLGQIFNGQTRGIKALGITVDSTKTDLENYESVLDQLGKKKGQFVESTKSFAGAFATLKLGFNDLFKEVALLDKRIPLLRYAIASLGWAFQKTADAIQLFRSSFSFLPDILEKLQLKFGGLVQSLFSGGRAAKDYKKEIGDLKGEVEALTTALNGQLESHRELARHQNEQIDMQMAIDLEEVSQKVKLKKMTPEQGLKENLKIIQKYEQAKFVIAQKYSAAELDTELKNVENLRTAMERSQKTAKEARSKASSTGKDEDQRAADDAEAAAEKAASEYSTGSEGSKRRRESIEREMRQRATMFGKGRELSGLKHKDELREVRLSAAREEADKRAQAAQDRLTRRGSSFNLDQPALAERFTGDILRGRGLGPLGQELGGATKQVANSMEGEAQKMAESIALLGPAFEKANKPIYEEFRRLHAKIEDVRGAANQVTESIEGAGKQFAEAIATLGPAQEKALKPAMDAVRRLERQLIELAKRTEQQFKNIGN